uniref:Hypothetical lipoprotein transmembrane n=1 Tax=Spiroplasma citri TaxID=2133 RepID=Q14L80_SPICI|nr:hypothetical lipoprotein transmembrane [Spiroplasma citri]
MKKWLSIIGAIGLTATSTTTLISCKKENNNKNEEDNKPKPSYNPQQPPKDSNWKNISGTFNQEFNVRNNKWYIISARKPKTTDNYKIIKFKNNDIDKPFGNVWNSGVALNEEWYSVIQLYRWEGVGEPETPTINENTCEITDWKEQKGT